MYEPRGRTTLLSPTRNTLHWASDTASNVHRDASSRAGLDRKEAGARNSDSVDSAVLNHPTSAATASTTRTANTSPGRTSILLNSRGNLPWWLRDTTAKQRDQLPLLAENDSPSMSSSRAGVHGPDGHLHLGAGDRPLLEDHVASAMGLPVYTTNNGIRINAGASSSWNAGPSSLRSMADRIFFGQRAPIALNTRLSRRERALWNWANVEDLDSFLQEVGGNDLVSIRALSSDVRGDPS